MDTTRRLVIARHAAAESFAARDLDRALTPTGRASARVLGRWLAGIGVTPDIAYVSYAARAVETWALVAEGAGWSLQPQVDGSLYSTDDEGVLELLRTTAEDVATVMLVGHNPTLEMLAQSLDDGDGAATGAIERGTFPTSTAAVFEVPGAWADLAPMGARLEAFEIARDD